MSCEHVVEKVIFCSEMDKCGLYLNHPGDFFFYYPEVMSRGPGARSECSALGGVLAFIDASEVLEDFVMKVEKNLKGKC